MLKDGACEKHDGMFKPIKADRASRPITRAPPLHHGTRVIGIWVIQLTHEIGSCTEMAEKVIVRSGCEKKKKDYEALGGVRPGGLGTSIPNLFPKQDPNKKDKMNFK
jgi:hypothetical protein